LCTNHVHHGVNGKDVCEKCTNVSVAAINKSTRPEVEILSLFPCFRHKQVRMLTPSQIHTALEKRRQTNLYDSYPCFGNKRKPTKSCTHTQQRISYLQNPTTQGVQKESVKSNSLDTPNASNLQVTEARAMVRVKVKVEKPDEEKRIELYKGEKKIQDVRSVDTAFDEQLLGMLIKYRLKPPSRNIFRVDGAALHMNPAMLDNVHSVTDYAQGLAVHIHRRYRIATNVNNEKAPVKDDLFMVPELCRMTGIKADIVEYGLRLLEIVAQLRYDNCLTTLEGNMCITFPHLSHLKAGLTLPSSPPTHISSFYNKIIPDLETSIGAQYLYDPVRTSFLLQGIVQRAKRLHYRHKYIGYHVQRMICASHIFFLDPSWTTDLQRKFVLSMCSQSTFLDFSLKLQLRKYVYAPAQRSSKSATWSQDAVSLCLAVFGVIYMDLGFSACRKLFTQLQHSPNGEKNACFCLTPRVYPTSERKLSAEEDSIIEKLRGIIGVTFDNRALLLQAITHPSYRRTQTDSQAHHERLLFLGEVLLHFVTNVELAKENTMWGDMKLQSISQELTTDYCLANVCDTIGLSTFVRCSRAEAGNVVYAQCFKALLCAMYIDQNIRAVRKFVRNSLLFPYAHKMHVD